MKRYADDYEIQVVKDEKGRDKKVAVYRGNFFEVNLDEKQLILLRKRSILLFLIVVALQIAGGFVANRGMYAFYVALPYVFAFLPLYYLGTGIFRMPTRKRKYHREEVGLSFERAKKANRFLLIILGVGVIGEIIYLIFFSQDGRSLEWLFLGSLLLTAGFSYCLYRLLKSIQVTECDEAANA